MVAPAKSAATPRKSFFASEGRFGFSMDGAAVMGYNRVTQEERN